MTRRRRNPVKPPTVEEWRAIRAKQEAFKQAEQERRAREAPLGRDRIVLLWDDPSGSGTESWTLAKGVNSTHWLSAHPGYTRTSQYRDGAEMVVHVHNAAEVVRRLAEERAAREARRAARKKNPSLAYSPRVQDKLARLRWTERDASEARLAHMSDPKAEAKYLKQLNEARSERLLLEEKMRLASSPEEAWARTYHGFGSAYVPSGVHDNEVGRRGVAARKLRREAGRRIAQVVSTRKPPKKRRK